MEIKNLAKRQKEVFFQNLMKSYSEGVYVDSPKNRKLGRVGMSYSTYTEKVRKEQEKENKIVLFKDLPFERKYTRFGRGRSSWYNELSLGNGFSILRSEEKTGPRSRHTRPIYILSHPNFSEGESKVLSKEEVLDYYNNRKNLDFKEILTENKKELIEKEAKKYNLDYDTMERVYSIKHLTKNDAMDLLESVKPFKSFDEAYNFFAKIEKEGKDKNLVEKNPGIRRKSYESEFMYKLTDDVCVFCENNGNDPWMKKANNDMKFLVFVPNLKNFKEKKAIDLVRTSDLPLFYKKNWNEE